MARLLAAHFGLSPTQKAQGDVRQGSQIGPLAPTDPNSGMTGWIPRSSMCSRRSTSLGAAPRMSAGQGVGPQTT